MEVGVRAWPLDPLVEEEQHLLHRHQGSRLDDAIRPLISSRREKIEVNPSEPAHLQTVWGVGYRLVP